MAPKASKAAPVGGTPPRPSPQKVSDPPAPVPTPQQPSKERPDPKKKGYAKLEEGVEEGRPWSNATEAAMERHQTKQAASKTSHPQQLCRALVSFLMATRLPLVYYSLGCAFYWYVEGWAPLDTVYFLTVTSTTVGYGDISPVSTIGKLFTCFYALVGITVVLGALAPLAQFLKGDWREKLLTVFGCSAKVNTDDMSLTMEEVNRRINYPRRYALALLGPLLVLLTGVLLHYFAIRDPADGGGALDALTDAFYFSLITMSTIGYGDITPISPTAKVIAILYLPVAVLALADAVSDVQLISLRRTIRETDFSKLADECLIRDALREAEVNNAPHLSEAEFLVDQLLANELVDKAAIIAIKRQFRDLTSLAKWDSDEDRQLDARQVYDMLRSRVESGKEVSHDASEIDVEVDPQTGRKRFKWSSFEEWKTNSWELRLAQKAIEEGREDYIGFGDLRHSTFESGGTGLKTVVGAFHHR